MSSTNVGEVLALAERAVDRRDAQYLLAHLLGLSRAALFARPDRILDATLASTYRAWIAERANGKPVAQILGTREFYGRDFGINAHVLIPRPETEILVDQALARLLEQKRPETPADIALSMLDLGTGSGAIAITLALEAPMATVTAVDISVEALERASANAAALNAKVTFVRSDWYAALGGQQFNVIVANPPYVARNDPHLTQGDLRFEPKVALTDQSDDGLASIRVIVNGAAAHMVADGWLLVEHGFDQAPRVRRLMESTGFQSVTSVRDLAGIERVTLGQLAVAHEL